MVWVGVPKSPPRYCDFLRLLLHLSHHLAGGGSFLRLQLAAV